MYVPIADSCRAILDGHVVLSRDLASQGHYPAVDVLVSVSRLMTDIAEKGHLEIATRIRSILATVKSVEDLLAIGAYVKGSNPKVDHALDRIDAINAFLCQTREEKGTWSTTLEKLAALKV